MIQSFLRKHGGARFAAPLALASALVLALALAGCGRRGGVEAPPTSAPEGQANSAAPGPSAVSLDAAATNIPAAPAPAAKPASPNPQPPLYKSFFLDPLVK